MALAIEHQDIEAETTIITLRGKLMLGEDVRKLEALLPDLLKNGRKNLVFDLGGVTHIDSTGIGRFIDTYGRVGQIGGQIRMCCATGAVRDAFRVTRLDTVFPFFPTVELACAGLK